MNDTVSGNSESLNAAKALSPVQSSGWMVKHRLPGRVRLQNLALRGNDDVARGIQNTLSTIPGVHDVEVSTALGTVLVVFNEQVWSLPSLIREIDSAHRLPARRKKSAKGQMQKSQRKDGTQSASWMAHAAHGLKEFAVSLNDGVKKNTGGKVELRQIVLSFLLARVGLQAGRTGLAAWETIENALEFIIAYTLYHHPDVEKEVRDAEDVVNPGL